MPKKQKKKGKARSEPRRPPVPPVPAEAFYLRPDQIAEQGQIGLMRTYEFIHQGVIPAIKIGRHYRIPRQQFLSLLAANPGLLAAPVKPAVGR
jgi:excisionase family DNA binding protein